MQFREVIQEYELDCYARKLAGRSIRGYVRMLGYLAEYLEKNLRITENEDIRGINIKKFLFEKERRGRKPSYINDLLKVLKMFFHYCLTEEYLQKSPTMNVHNVRQPKVLIRSFTEEEIKKVLASIQGKDFISVRNKTILCLFFDRYDEALVCEIKVKMKELSDEDFCDYVLNRVKEDGQVLDALYYASECDETALQKQGKYGNMDERKRRLDDEEMVGYGTRVAYFVVFCCIGRK